MIRNEYGAVQQHLEPQHIKDILIPIPDDWNNVKDVVERTKHYFETKEELERANSYALETFEGMIKRLTSD